MNHIVTFYPQLIVGFAALVGLIFGSFANVLIYRLPLGLSVIKPRSACPGCNHAIPWQQDIPLLSWALLRGKCKGCKMAISVRYPIVELLGAGIFAYLTHIFFGRWLLLGAWLLFGFVALAASAIDFDKLILPDVLTGILYLVGGAILIGVTWQEGNAWPLVRAGISGAAAFIFFGGLWWFYPKGMGLGDVKLSGILGAYLGFLGWSFFPIGILTAFTLGLLGSIPTLTHRSRTMSIKKTKNETLDEAVAKRGIPFGPYLFAGALLAPLMAPPIARWYLGLAGLTMWG